MTANELRIGNVLFGGVVCEITEKYFVVNDGYSKWKSNEMVDEWIADQPIKLNEEWFLRLGLEEGNKGYYAKDDVVISVEGEVYFGETETWIATIYYVHSLQNLIFALKGEELTIKEA
jgi:hypothetical protein